MKAVKWFLHPFSYMPWWQIGMHMMLAIGISIGFVFFSLKSVEGWKYKLMAFIFLYLLYFFILRMYYWKRNS